MAGQTLPDNALRTAIKNALDADVSITEPVYDYRVEPDTPMPYFYIGAVDNLLNKDKTNWGTNTTVTIHAWSADITGTEVSTMINNANKAITENYPLTITGFQNATGWLDSSITFPSIDMGNQEQGQEAWHGILKMGFIIRGNAQ